MTKRDSVTKRKTLTKRKTVIVIDDHPVVLRGLRDLFASSDDFNLVGEALNGYEAMQLVRERRPTLVVLDLRLSDCLAPELCAQIRVASPETKVVILTAFDDRVPIEASLKAGASGVLLKDVHDVDMLEAFRKVLSGCLVVDERVGNQELGVPLRFKAEPGGCYGPLTSREYDVLRLLAQGMTSKEIADHLSLATNTVRGYAQTLIMKLQSNTRIQALATAKRLRLI